MRSGRPGFRRCRVISFRPQAPAACPSRRRPRRARPSRSRRARCPAAAVRERGSDSRDRRPSGRCALKVASCPSNSVTAAETSVVFAKKQASLTRKARREIVRPVGDDVVARDQIERVIAASGARAMRLDHGRSGLMARSRRRAADSVLGRPDIGRPMRDLALEIGKRNRIEIDDADRAHTGRREIEDHAGCPDRPRRPPAPGPPSAWPGPARPLRAARYGGHNAPVLRRKASWRPVYP